MNHKIPQLSEEDKKRFDYFKSKLGSRVMNNIFKDYASIVNKNLEIGNQQIGKIDNIETPDLNVGRFFNIEQIQSFIENESNNQNKITNEQIYEKMNNIDKKMDHIIELLEGKEG